jgi:dCMP deaminase
MKERVKSLYMDMAQRAAQMSRANRLKVGCLVVKDDNIISFSWNGTPAGWDNDCEDETNITKPEVIHAEANAVSKLAKNAASGSGATMFITHAPCMECAKLIYGAGITNVLYRNQYRSDAGIEFLIKCNVTVEQYEK